MTEERECLSEIIRYGEQVCVIRDVRGGSPPDCRVCPLLSFCEEPRTDDEILEVVIAAERNRFRREYFAQMEDAEYEE